MNHRRSLDRALILSRRASLQLKSIYAAIQIDLSVSSACASESLSNTHFFISGSASGVGHVLRDYHRFLESAPRLLDKAEYV
jgi:hypothetical protein